MWTNYKGTLEGTKRTTKTWGKRIYLSGQEIKFDPLHIRRKGEFEINHSLLYISDPGEAFERSSKGFTRGESKNNIGLRLEKKMRGRS